MKKVELKIRGNESSCVPGLEHWEKEVYGKKSLSHYKDAILNRLNGFGIIVNGEEDIFLNPNLIRVQKSRQMKLLDNTIFESCFLFPNPINNSSNPHDSRPNRSWISISVEGSSENISTTLLHNTNLRFLWECLALSIQICESCGLEKANVSNFVPIISGYPSWIRMLSGRCTTNDLFNHLKRCESMLYYTQYLPQPRMDVLSSVTGNDESYNKETNRALDDSMVEINNNKNNNNNQNNSFLERNNNITVYILCCFQNEILLQRSENTYSERNIQSKNTVEIDNHEVWCLPHSISINDESMIDTAVRIVNESVSDINYYVGPMLGLQCQKDNASSREIAYFGVNLDYKDSVGVNQQMNHQICIKNDKVQFFTVSQIRTLITFPTNLANAIDKVLIMLRGGDENESASADTYVELNDLGNFQT